MKSQELLEEVDNVFINLLVKHECRHMERKTRMSVAHVSIRDSSEVKSKIYQTDWFARLKHVLHAHPCTCVWVANISKKFQFFCREGALWRPG